jgi:ankyrin repeat protein
MKATNAKGKNVLHLALGTSKVKSNPAMLLKINEIVKLPCETGVDNNRADLNAKDGSRDELAPLHYCAKYYLTEAARSLLENGADVNIKDKKGCTPLYYIATDPNPEMELTKTLIDYNGSLAGKRFSRQARPRQSPQNVWMEINKHKRG